MDQQVRYCTTADGADIAYSVVGEGLPIVRVLGWFTHLGLEWEHDETREFWEQLAAGHTLLRYDGRGIGLSQGWRGDFSAETRYADLAAVVKAAGLERFSLFAQSEGCVTALRYAAAHPDSVEKLVLFGGYVRYGGTREISPAGREEQQAMLTLMRRGWGQDEPRFRQLFTSIFIPSATGEQKQWFNDLQRESAKPSTAVSMLRSVYSADAREEAANVAVPTLVLHLRHDQAVPFSWGRHLAAQVSGAQLVTLEGDCHFIGVSPRQNEAIANATLRFLDGLPKTERPAGQMSQEPMPTSTFRAILFTDVVASTPLLAQLKDEKMRAVMRDHDEVLEAAVTDNGGRVVKTIGDAFMAEFTVPSGAVEAAIAAQRGIRDRFADSDVPIRLRIGINAGEPIEEDGDLHGASVVIAKRLESEADNGGILVSEVVRQAVAGKEFEFTDRGEVSLKGFDEPVRAWSVDWE